MRADSVYPVLRCGRCSLIHPHRYRLCPRCGGTEPDLAWVSRRQVEDAALEFLVASEAITVPPEVPARHAGRRTAAEWALDRTPSWMTSLGQRVGETLAGAQLRPIGAAWSRVTGWRGRS